MGNATSASFAAIGGNLLSADGVDVSVAADGGAVLTLSRLFYAPPERVFRAFTEGNEIAKWFGPETHHCTVNLYDCRPGGEYSLKIQSEGGSGVGLSGRFLTVEPPTHLSFSWIWGGTGPMANQETVVDIQFVPEDENCRLLLRHSAFKGKEFAEQHQFGWNSSFVCLVNLITDG